MPFRKDAVLDSLSLDACSTVQCFNAAVASMFLDRTGEWEQVKYSICCRCGV